MFDLRNKLRAQQLSIEEELLRRTFEESIGITEQEVELSEEGVTEQYGEYGVGMLARRYNVSRKEIAKQLASSKKKNYEIVFYFFDFILCYYLFFY